MGAARRSGHGARSERSRLWNSVSGRAGRGPASQQSSRTPAASMAGLRRPPRLGCSPSLAARPTRSYERPWRAQPFSPGPEVCPAGGPSRPCARCPLKTPAPPLLLG